MTVIKVSSLFFSTFTFAVAACAGVTASVLILLGALTVASMIWVDMAIEDGLRRSKT